jgi:hypothetical protein
MNDKSRDRYFFFASATLLLVVIAGFSPTLYLKFLFDTFEVPIYLQVHGAVITLWFLWLVSQTSLIAIHRVDLHRRLGKIAALFGFAVVPAGLMANFRMVPRLRETGLDTVANLEAATTIVWGNLFDLLAFTCFLLVALYFRRRSEIHKRLMLFASLAIMLPALARISHWPVFSSIGEIPFALSGLLLLLSSLFVHDFMTRRRPHVATVVGASCYILNIIVSVATSETEFARNFVLGP